MAKNDNENIDDDNDSCHPYRTKPLKIQCLVLGSAGCGKTSILRRYFQRMENYNSHQHHPTMGAFYYSQRVSNPLYRHSSTKQNFSEQQEHTKRNEISVPRCSKSERNKKKKRTKKRVKRHFQQYKQQTFESNYSSNDTINKVTISQQQHVHLHMWDTAGFNTQFLLLDNQDDDSFILTKSLGDSIFRYANVAMLVYDATSSRSFTQLLRWYSELQTRLKLLHVSKTPTTHQSPRFPILIVANKMDLVKKKQRKTNDTNAKSSFSTTTITNDPQKMESIKNESLKHMNHHSSVTSSSIPIVPQRIVLGIQQTKNNQEYEFSSGFNSSSSSPLNFLGLQRTSWVSYFHNEGDYLQCLLSAEDQSIPGEEMVLSWCQRHHLTHVEVSAFDGKESLTCT